MSGAAGLKKTASLIGKETDERSTSNVQRPTPNIVFYQFKNAEHAAPVLRQRIYGREFDPTAI